MVIFAEPLNVGCAVFVFKYLVGEVGGYLAEVVFDGGEDALLLVVGVVGYEQADTGGGDDADGASAAIEQVIGGALIEVADDQDGAACTLG